MHIPTVIKGEGEREEAKLGRNLLFRGLKFRSSVCVGINLVVGATMFTPILLLYHSDTNYITVIKY